MTEANNTPILVTGAAGLAGSAVVEHFRSKLYTCVMPITRAECDLMDPVATRELFARAKPVHVFHSAACVYGLGGNMENQAKSFYQNTMINTNVIDAAYRAGVKKITVMGTNAVYPHPPKLPYREDDIFNGRPHEGESAYGQSKRAMLAMLEAYHTSHQLDYAYLVSGNLYGPRDKFDPITGHVMPTMIYKFHKAAQTGGDVELWGDGSALRDFLYSEDLARAAELLMFDECFHGPINIGSGHLYSILTVATCLSEISGVPLSRVKFDSSKPNGRLNCVADLTKLNNLGFAPLYSLRRGLHETWDWYDANSVR